MLSSRVLTRQWKGASAGFGRSQATLKEDSAAGDGKFHVPSKSHLRRMQSMGPGSHPALIFNTGETLLGLRSGCMGRARARPGLLRVQQTHEYREECSTHHPHPWLCPRSSTKSADPSNGSLPPAPESPRTLNNKGLSKAQKAQHTCSCATSCWSGLPTASFQSSPGPSYVLDLHVTFHRFARWYSTLSHLKLAWEPRVH